MITLEQLTEYISSFVDYLENFIPQSIERDNAITRLKESVFWLTYIDEKQNSK